MAAQASRLIFLTAVALLNLPPCDPSADRSAAAPVTSTAPERAVSLSREKVPTESFRLDGLAEDARFIEDTTTGGFRVRPRVGVDPGARVRLKGKGCTDAHSVNAVLFRVEPLRAGQHDADQTWIDTRVFPTTTEGWSGSLRLPKSPSVAEYGVWAVCELDGHAYFPSAWDVYVGP